MKQYSYKEVDFLHSDDRGKLFQISHKNCKQVNLLVSKKGAIRGKHYHKKATESFFIINGKVNVKFYSKDKIESKIFKKNDYFEVYPLVKHEMFFLSDCTMIVIYNRNIENIFKKKDIYME